MSFKLKRLVLPSVASVVVMALSACGGSGVDSSQVAAAVPSTISGKVLDGYIRGATVFWDCNTNGVLDANEVSTKSTAGGVYNIDKAPQSNCRLTALIPGTAIDEDTGKSVLSPYMMTALDSNATIISPLTTLAVLNSSSTQGVAAEEIKQKFGLKISIDSDYIKTTTDDAVIARKFAKVTAQLLQDGYSPLAAYHPLANNEIINAISAIQNSINQANLIDITKRLIALPIIQSSWQKFWYLDYSIKSKVNPANLTASQIAGLNEILADSAIAANTANGMILWNCLDQATLKRINDKLFSLGFLTPNSAALTSEFTRANASIFAKYNPLLQDAVEGIVMTPKTAEALFDIFESTMKGGFGAAKIGLSFGLSNVFANIKMTPGSQGKLIKNLDKLAKYPHFAATALSCGFSIDEVRNAFNSTELSATEYKGAMQSVSALVGCIGDLLDGRPSGDAISYFVGLFDAGSSGVEDKFDAVMTLLDTLNIIIGYSPPTPFTNFVSGFIDVLSAGVDSYKAGQTIANEADAATDVAQAEIKKLQDKEIANVLKQYTIKNIIARLGSKLVREDLIIALPSVTDISPKSVVAGQSTVFTVTGANLPLTALLSMNNAAQSCDAPTNNTPTGFTTKCTAANTTSTSVTVVGSLDGTVLETQAVVVTTVSTTSFTVSAANEQGTTFNVPSGKSSCVFTSTGLWSEIGNPRFGANGIGYNISSTYLPSAPLGALIARRGASYVFIGSSATLSVSANESIVFLINDAPKSFGDNGGSLTVVAKCI